MMFISVVLPEPDGPKIATAKAAAGVSNLRRSMHSIILILVNVIDQSACSDNLLHEGRKRLSFELPVLRLVGDDTGIEIDFDLITRLNCFCRLRAFDNRQSDIDRITVKIRAKVCAITQLTPAALIAIGACSLEEPQPKFLSATMISPGFTFLMKSLSISSMQCCASSAGSEEFK